MNIPFWHYVGICLIWLAAAAAAGALAWRFFLYVDLRARGFKSFADERETIRRQEEIRAWESARATEEDRLRMTTPVDNSKYSTTSPLLSISSGWTNQREALGAAHAAAGIWCPPYYSRNIGLLDMTEEQRKEYLAYARGFNQAKQYSTRQAPNDPQ